MARPVHAALLLLVSAVVLLGAVTLTLGMTGPAGMGWTSVLYALVAWVYAAAGALAWWRRPGNYLGAIMLLGCLSLLVAGLANTDVAELIAVGTIGATVILAVVVHLLHAFPSGRLRGAWSRATVWAGYLVCLVLQVPLYLFAPAPEPHHLLGLVDRPDIAEAGGWVQAVAGAAVMVATTVILALRLERTDPMRRRVLVPLYAYGIAVVLFIPVSAQILMPLLDLTSEAVTVLQLLAIGGIPIAFALGVLRGGYARTGQLDELGTWLGTAADHPGVREALARTLGDPSLRLLFWAPDEDGYVDAAGRRAELPAADDGSDAVEIELDDRLVGAVVFDATLLDDRELVRAAGRVVALAVDRERLTAALLASEEALRRSRERIVRAGDLERRRIAQNLHDVLQTRLVLLALQAQQIAGDPSAPDRVAQCATALRASIDDAAAELRHFVHAVMPAALVERGLSVATEALVDRVPIPTKLQLGVPDRRMPMAVESTAYFVVAEALSNAVKHAGAHQLSVGLQWCDDRLVIDVQDDGVGGASIGDGLGLRGMADRVDVLGGRLRLDSPPGGGTHLVAELPCAS
jgi:signal transduction histidine kinase